MEGYRDKTYKVRVTVDWELEVEASDEYDAERLAEDYVYGDYGFALSPEFVDVWAEEIVAISVEEV